MANLVCYIICLSCFGKSVSSIQIKVTVECELITLSCHPSEWDIREIKAMDLKKLNKTEDRFFYLTATTKYNETHPSASEVSATFPIADIHKNEYAVFSCGMVYVNNKGITYLPQENTTIFCTDDDTMAEKIRHVASHDIEAGRLFIVKINTPRHHDENTASLSVTGEYIGLTVGVFFGGFGAGACSIAAFVFLRKRLSRKQLLRSTNKSTHGPVIEHPGDTDGDNIRPEEVVQQVDNLPAYETLSHTMADSNYSVALTQTPRAAEVVYYNASAN